MTKAELRKINLERRMSLSPSDIATSSRKIADRFFSTVDIRSRQVLHTFIRIRRLNEIDTSVIYFRLWRDRPQLRTLAPRSDLNSGEMESVEFGPTTDLIENKWGIREPASGASYTPDQIDIVLIPVLALDLAGHRVGYGKGFYDRFLVKLGPDCLKVGLSDSPPIAHISDAQKHDIRLDLAITPDAVFEF